MQDMRNKMPATGGKLKDSSVTADMDAAPSVVASPGKVNLSVQVSDLGAAVKMVSKMNERGEAAPSIGGYKIDADTH